MAETEGSGAVTCTVVGMTDVGRVREHNEDNFLVMSSAEGRALDNGERCEFAMDAPMLLAVADGMGGAAAGEVASQMAVERFAKDLGNTGYKDASPDQLVAKIDQTLQAANEDIKGHADENPDRKGMGTTMTAAIVLPGQAFIAQVGDSRGYLLRKGKLLRLTRDQSLIEQLIDEGTITEEEAEKMGGRNIILQALGVEETVRPDTKPFNVLRGDTYLLCSDGLSGFVKDDLMEQIVNEAGDDLVEGVTRLVQAANDNGGRDNITVVLARFEGEGLRAPMETVAQDDIERTGVQFKAPPAAEVPNPMKRLSIIGCIIIAILAVLLMVTGRSDADLLLTLEPASVASFDVTLVDKESGEEVASRQGVSGEIRIEKLAPGEYELRVNADKHFEVSEDLRITEAGELSHSVELTAEPVNLTVTTNVDFVDVKVSDPTGKALDPAAAMKDNPAEWDNVPAGKVKIEASREGFRPYSVEVTLPPKDAFTHAITLEEVKGKLSITCSGAGFAVQVKDSRGILLAEGVTVGSEPLVLDVRIGEVLVQAKKAGFEPVEEKVKVEENGTATCAVPVTLQTRRVVFETTGTKKIYDPKLERRNQQGVYEPAGSLGFLINPNETSRTRNMEPGFYRLSKDGKVLKEFEVKSGDDQQVVRIK